MEKLELKHLAPYLPYGLKIMNTNTNEHEWEMCLSDAIQGAKNDILEVLTVGYQKPILRPLSDLTKGDVAYLGYNSSAKCIMDILEGDISYHKFEWLSSKHFDVFGLIEVGLAIDKNSIKP